MKRNEKAMEYARSKLNGLYSQEHRWRDSPYTRDCSSFVWSAYDSAGYRMAETTSTYEVSDKGFYQVFPDKGVALGEKYGDIQTIIKKGYEPCAGDLIFYNTTNTTRKNKITHVSIVEDSKNILHARSTKYGIRRDFISVHGNKIVAITRLKEELNIEIGESADNSKQDEKYKSAICTGNAVNIRERATASSPSLGKKNKGDSIEAQETKDDWCKVKANVHGKTIIGYMYRNYVKF